jgi:hypothetical protein
MMSINNIVSIDLTGQITCESQFGPRLINGAGGQIEFHIGAFLAKNGKAVSILSSTYGDGEISNIVPYFEKGTLVTLSRYWADKELTRNGMLSKNTFSGKTHHDSFLFLFYHVPKRHILKRNMLRCLSTCFLPFESARTKQAQLQVHR